MIEALFLISAAFVVYAYVGFPLLTWVRSLILDRPVACRPMTPSVSMIIACHNEQDGIEAKLLNTLALDYPAEELQVLVVADGCTDNTEAIVRSFDRVELISRPREGKARGLNAAVQQATGEVLVFSDANSMYAPDAIRKLVEPLADDSVGGVAGNQVYAASRSGQSDDAGEQRYWSFDRWMKTCQSRSGNTIAATGAIYAIRRSLFQSVPDGVTDDFVTSTRVILQGRRLVFAPDAICYEPTAKANKFEFGRKVRIITRGLRGVVAVRGLLNPMQHGYYAWQLFSHKVLRRLVAVPLLIMLITAPLLWQEHVAYQVIAVIEWTVLIAGLFGLALSANGSRLPKLITIPAFFVLVNAAVLVAMGNILRGKRITVWDPHRHRTVHAGGAS